MLKFGTPTIALPLAIKKCTVQTGCTVYSTCKFCSYNPLRRRSVILKLLPELFVYV